MTFRSLEYASREGFWDVWFKEVHGGQAGFTFKVKKIIHSGESGLQRIDIFDTYGLGKVLVMYGSIMITERDQFVYHEMLAHVSSYVHPAPRRVLIIGGGDGGTLREFCRHPVQRVTMVEIDRQVVELCREHFPDHHGFDDGRADLVFADGAGYVSKSDETFDIIAIDSADPVPPADVLFERTFFENCRRRLGEGGVLVAQTESPFLNPDVIGRVYETLRGVFKIVRMYTAVIPTYPGALWSFAFCSDSLDPLEHLDEARIVQQALPMSYYNASIHRAAFALPAFVERIVSR
jgi:spermidine synthase